MIARTQVLVTAWFVTTHGQQASVGKPRIGPVPAQPTNRRSIIFPHERSLTSRHAQSDLIGWEKLGTNPAELTSQRTAILEATGHLKEALPALEQIAKALTGQVETWAKEKGMTAVNGPMGFTDLDHEGMLVEGFDQIGTLAAIYNHPYYPSFIEKLGYTENSHYEKYSHSSKPTFSNCLR